MKLRHTLMALPFLLLMACKPAEEPSDTTTGDQLSGDHEALEACGASACKDAFAQRIEGGGAATMDDMECVVQGMRDRTVGLYHVRLDWTWSNGHQDTDTTLFVTPSGEVEIAVTSTSALAKDASGKLTTDTTQEPTERCSLASVSFFDSCLANVKKEAIPPMPGVNFHDPDAWACVYPDPTSQQALPWFTNCKVEWPTCK